MMNDREMMELAGTTPYAKAIKEYLNTPINIRNTCNAAHHLDDHELPKGDCISADEVRAGATVKGLRKLDDLEMPKGPRVRDVFKIAPIKEWAVLAAHKREQLALNRLLI